MKKRYFGLLGLPMLMAQCQPACVPVEEEEPVPVETTVPAPVETTPPVTVPATTQPPVVTTTPTTQPIPADQFSADVVYGDLSCFGTVYLGVDAGAPASYDTITFKGAINGVPHEFLLPLPLSSTAATQWDAGLNPRTGPYTYGNVVAVFHDNDGLVPDRQINVEAQPLVSQQCLDWAPVTTPDFNKVSCSFEPDGVTPITYLMFQAPVGDMTHYRVAVGPRNGPAAQSLPWPMLLRGPNNFMVISWPLGADGRPIPAMRFWVIDEATNVTKLTETYNWADALHREWDCIKVWGTAGGPIAPA